MMWTANVTCYVKLNGLLAAVKDHVLVVSFWFMYRQFRSAKVEGGKLLAGRP